MGKRFESILLGGAVVFGGLASARKGAATVQQIEELVDAVEDVRRQQAEPTPPIPGMPLPTGYGLQVRGPAGEEILVPVCLPPGFELDSMMLVPEFLPPRQGEAGDGPARPPVIVEEAPQPAPSRESLAVAPLERSAATMQIVYTAEQSYSSHVDAPAPGPLVDALTRRGERAVGVETHRLV